jgi:hypothetical protein
MTFLLAVLAGFGGGAAGAGFGALLLAMLGAVSGTPAGSDIGAAFLLAAIIVPLGTLAGLAGGVMLVLRRQGISGRGRITAYLASVFATVVCVAGAATWAYIFAIDDIMNPNGPTPRLAFEVRLPPGKALPGRNGIELHTDKNRMPGSWNPQSVRKEDDNTVFAGEVEMYFKVRNRMLEVTLADTTGVIFELDLARTPAHSKSFGPWRGAAFIAEPGRPSVRASPQDGYQIRYRAVWVGKD